MPQRPRLTVAKGRRPYFFDDPATDKLLAMVLALMGEVSVLKDRLDLHERLARAGKLATPENIDAMPLSEADEDERAAARAQSIDRVLRIIKQESEDDLRNAERNYSRMVEGIGRE